MSQRRISQREDVGEFGTLALCGERIYYESREVLQMLSNDVLTIFIVVLVIFYWKKIGPAIQDLWRGGPRPPSHPLPGDDSRILTRRRRRVSV